MTFTRLAAAVARIGLGALFIYASHSKILDPSGFARTVYHYKLLPAGAVNLVAIVLPWVELLVGLFLVLGFKVRGAALVATLSLVVFLGALSSAMARGLNIACGCFSATGGKVGPDRIIGDLVLIAVAVFVYRHAASRSAAAAGASVRSELGGAAAALKERS